MHSRPPWREGVVAPSHVLRGFRPPMVARPFLEVATQKSRTRDDQPVKPEFVFGNEFDFCIQANRLSRVAACSASRWDLCRAARGLDLRVAKSRYSMGSMFEPGVSCELRSSLSRCLRAAMSVSFGKLPGPPLLPKRCKPCMRLRPVPLWRKNIELGSRVSYKLQVLGATFRKKSAN